MDADGHDPELDGDPARLRCLDDGQETDRWSENICRGLLVSLAALVLDFVIAGYGLEMIKLHAFR